MRAGDRVDRRLAAAGLVGVPLLVLVLPALLSWGADHATPEEQFTAMAGAPATYGPLFLQAAGAVCLLAASLGVLGVVLARGRGIVLGWLTLVLGAVSTCALLLALGAEMAVATILGNATDVGAAVATALTVNSSTVFVSFLWTGLAGVFLVLPLAALALWRSGVVPVVVAVLFLLPVAIGFVPLPSEVANLAPSLALLLPTGWMAIRLVTTRPSASRRAPVPAPALAPRQS
jgi:hypothetical protein